MNRYHHKPVLRDVKAAILRRTPAATSENLRRKPVRVGPLIIVCHHGYAASCGLPLGAEYNLRLQRCPAENALSVESAGHFHALFTKRGENKD
jgi:hypothetical protein